MNYNTALALARRGAFTVHRGTYDVVGDLLIPVGESDVDYHDRLTSEWAAREALARDARWRDPTYNPGDWDF